MARQAVQIMAAVGKRNGITPLANQAQDVATITDLLDRIGPLDGGTAGAPGNWALDQPTLIEELSVQIGVFQTVNQFAKVDNAVDPNGTTLRVMNRLAAEPPLAAMIAGFGGFYEQDFINAEIKFAEPGSVPGHEQLAPYQVAVEYSRRLVMVTGSSIRWFGVVLPTPVGNTLDTAIPHLFFTPTPIQGGYRDDRYDSFAGWGQLWDDYTSRIGGLLAASAANQVLVIPFYKTGQMNDLGVFLTHWQEVISKVVTVAVNDMNPYYMPGAFSFGSINSSSFSNGVTAHRGFNTRGADAAAMTAVLFDLDGQAQTGGSSWRPPNGVIYHNTGIQGANPRGRNFHVGGRWRRFDTEVGPTSQYSHHACSQYLLAHGLSEFSL